MAASDKCHVTFECIEDNFFYFQVTDNELLSDSFRKEGSSTHLLFNKTCGYLILDGESFNAEQLTIKEVSQRDLKFTIQTYKNSSKESIEGKSVMLYVTKGGQNMVACCSGDRNVCAEAMDVPMDVEGTKHKALFYMKAETPSKTYIFESSIHQDHYLAVDSSGCGPYKLVLRNKSQDQVDKELDYNFRQLPT
ncbi:interleukin-18-like [Pholidichthys leucotaenia]